MNIVHYLYFWLARLLLLRPAANGTQSELRAEHAHCPSIVAGLAIRNKHVDE